MAHGPKRNKLYLAVSDGRLLATRPDSPPEPPEPDPVARRARAAERAALDAVWRQAELDATELRDAAARYRAEQAAQRVAERRERIALVSA